MGNKGASFEFMPGVLSDPEYSPDARQIPLTHRLGLLPLTITSRSQSCRAWGIGYFYSQ